MNNILPKSVARWASTALLLLVMVGTAGEAAASGLGKFVGGGSSKREIVPCEAPAGRRGLAERLRLAVMPGVTGALRDDTDSRFSIYGDIGFRALMFENSCSKSKGLFSSSSWWAHSVMIGIDTELITKDPGESPVGLMVAYEMRRRSRGFLSGISEIFPLGFGLSLGPHRAPGTWGIGGSMFLRAVFDFRVGLDYDFDDTLVTSLHVGLIDPHLLVLAIIREATD